MNHPSPNQYAPPRAQVEDVYADGGVAELKLFSAKGRIGRLRFLAYMTGASLLLNVLAIAFTALAELGIVRAVLLFACFGAFFWFVVISGIKRCHDCNQSGWWVISYFIPLVGLYWLFVRGSQGANRFGPPPPANTLGVRVLGLAMPVLVAVGIVAAIALPAYKDYTDRARGFQVGPPK